MIYLTFTTVIEMSVRRANCIYKKEIRVQTRLDKINSTCTLLYELL